MKKIISLALCLVLCFSVFVSCAKDDGSSLTKSVYEAAENVQSQFDFGETAFYKDTDEYAVDCLMYQYGIEDQTVLDAVDQFVITVPATNSAKTFALISFKEGTAAETIDAAKQAIETVYIANLINSTAVYDITQSEIADKASFVTYDNALLVVVYDANGNTEVIGAVNS